MQDCSPEVFICVIEYLYTDDVKALWTRHRSDAVKSLCDYQKQQSLSSADAYMDFVQELAQVR